MKLISSTFALIITAIPVLCSPTLGIAKIKNRSDQGDGLYILTHDVNNAPVIKFTPMAELGLPPVNTTTLAEKEAQIEKRDGAAALDGVTCGAGNVAQSELQSATDCLTRAANLSPGWGFHTWVWVSLLQFLNLRF
jgi:hypothetical protein